ncbi:MAG: cation transporter [Clostridiales bacterium]|nr:MAG: cation transporter [Clostridiales bacterium]
MGSSNIRFSNLKIISYYTGCIIIGVALLMIIPLITSVIMQELNPAVDFLISISVSLISGLILIIFGKRAQINKDSVQWKHGFVVAALSWIILTILCAIPYRLSGHNNSMLDSCFDVMSGFTTTGLVLTQDLDHLSLGLNMWRHILTFVGGQGMVVLALSFLVKEISGAYKLYVGEAKDIGLVPNVKGTARIIWKISMIYFGVGTLALWINGILIGLKPVSALFHGMFIFASAWSTGGFAPNTQNMMYYHSFSYEIITIIFFILGSLNFGLHYAVWQKKKREIVRNIETQSFMITAFLCSVFAVISLANIYPNAVSIFRRVVYNVLSAHTTTGFGNVYARQFALEWGDFGIFIMVIAMLIGGSACSTAGGFKGLRVGIIFKSIVADVKKLLSSERSVKQYKYHHIKDYVLEDSVVRSSAVIVICYIVTFTLGTAIGAFYGYSLADSAFEAASVTGNVGLSIGVTTPSTPALLKIYYILAMYMGRLEFLSVFALVGSCIGGVKKLCRKLRRA